MDMPPVQFRCPACGVDLRFTVTVTTGAHQGDAVELLVGLDDYDVQQAVMHLTAHTTSRGIIKDNRFDYIGLKP